MADDVKDKEDEAFGQLAEDLKFGEEAILKIGEIGQIAAKYGVSAKNVASLMLLTAQHIACDNNVPHLALHDLLCQVHGSHAKQCTRCAKEIQQIQNDSMEGPKTPNPVRVV